MVRVLGHRDIVVLKFDRPTSAYGGLASGVLVYIIMFWKALRTDPGDSSVAEKSLACSIVREEYWRREREENCSFRLMCFFFGGGGAGHDMGTGDIGIVAKVVRA